MQFNRERLCILSRRSETGASAVRSNSLWGMRAQPACTLSRPEF
ncbi:hypothetical protein K788_0006469 [Paraburkholderia caribensis MBA4]|uniref:Uncharacterized protein n=1 Tax=Paraburkholderia caribensis MBA4 TaxID=1323664 RepID=A0A0P0RBD8_9BURK|nr:hypothetical protein K788_0006469 [Paraburkholderia caribensis MBA4]